MLQRRSILKGLVGLVAAPAIIKVAGIMPVKASLQPSAFDSISMRSLVEYAPGADQAVDRLDILFNSYLTRPGWVLEADGTGTLPKGTRGRVKLPSDYDRVSEIISARLADLQERIAADAMNQRLDIDFVRADARNGWQSPSHVARGDLGIVPDNLALTAVAIAVAPAMLKTPVTRRFWATP